MYDDSTDNVVKLVYLATFNKLLPNTVYGSIRVSTDLWDELIVIGEMCPAVDAAVGSVTVGQVSLEGLRLCHFYHLTVTVALLTGFLWAGARRVAALLNLLTEEALEDAS